MSTIKSSNEHLTLNADGSGKDIKFQSNGSEVAQITDGGVVSSTGGSTHADNVKARFGTGDDLEIYHDGSNSIIKDVGDGELQLITNGTKISLKTAEGDTLAAFNRDGDSSLRYDGSKKIATTAGGVAVTGRGTFSDGVAITDGTTEYCLHVTANSQQHNLFRIDNTNTTSTNHSICVFRRNGTETGSIRHTNNSTSYNTSSDYRLKENVDYTWDATTRLKQLKPARFNFLNDDTKTVDGFLAHEVSTIVPEAIGGTKDAVDDDGNAVYQSIDQSKLVPLLVKTIQELEARITTLEG